MASISGILNHNTTAAQTLASANATPNAATSNSSSTSSASSSAATISSNDFLTLLVTEMKNQDPTATTDPNEYINQLVNVNSLEQLISINQTLTTDLAPTTSANSGTPSAQASSLTGSGANAQASASGSIVNATQSATSSNANTVPNATSTTAAKLAPGNLSIPPVNQSAQSVAQALSGRPRAH